MTAREPENSFCIYVCSNHGTDVFPDNTSSKFSNPLPETLKLDKFDVALSKISFHDRYYEKPRETVFHPVPKTGGSIFHNTIFGNVVQYYQYKQQTVNIKKTYDSFVNFIAGLNASLVRLGIEANFTPEYDGEKPVGMTFSFDNTDGYVLRMGLQLPQILGFQKSSFPEGNHKSTIPPDYELFKSIDLEKSFPISKQKYDTVTVSVEHMDTPSLADIMMDIQLKLTQEGKRITIIVNENDSTLRVDTGDQFTYLILSRFLNNYINLPPNHMFRGDTTVKVPPEVLNPASLLSPESYIRPTTPPADISLNKVLVLASCASPSVYKEKYLPIIGVLDRLEGSETYNFTANPAVYFPVGIRETSSIEIQLLSDQLVLLDSFKNPTVVELHFKRVRV